VPGCAPVNLLEDVNDLKALKQTTKSSDMEVRYPRVCRRAGRQC